LPAFLVHGGNFVVSTMLCRCSRAQHCSFDRVGGHTTREAHHLASLLIAGGADVKTVQARMRHASARTTLDTYGHLWPDADESTRAAVGAVIAERIKSAA
jgi:integrase